MMTTETDRRLLDRVVAGDTGAFARLFDRHANRIYNYCFRRTMDWTTAEDLTSATFLEAWRRRTTVVEGDSALPWLLGVATNLLRNLKRSRRRYRQAIGRVPPSAHEPDFADELAARLDDQERMKRLLESLHQLNRLDRDVIHLHIWTGLTYEETAKALGIPVGTVRSRLSRARSRLRWLTRDEDDVPTDTVQGERQND